MKEYQEKQAEFAAHIRNPGTFPKPADVEDRRMAIYRDLFFNNIENFIASAFPVFKSLFTGVAWQLLIREFIETHHCKTPYFLEISQEFLAFLDNEDLTVHQAYPFAAELCHYEWVELAIDISDEKNSVQVDANADLLDSAVHISSLAWPLMYQWPVHQIGIDALPEKKPEQPTCLVVYRSRNGMVEFMQANPVTLRLIEILDSEPFPTGRQALRQIATELGHDKQAIIDFGCDILEQLKALGIVLGSKR